MMHRRIQVRHAVDAVEAAYSLDGTHDAWLASVLEAVHRDLDLGSGMYTFSAQVTASGFRPDSAFVSRALDPAFLSLMERLNRDPPGELLDVLGAGLVRVGGLEQVLGADHAITRHFRATAEGTGFVDGFTMFAQDGEGAGICLAAPARSVERHASTARAIWRRVGLHVAAALRLRRKLAAGPARCEALLTPGGSVADAQGALRDDGDLRARLRAAVANMETARTSAVRNDPERAFQLWQGLVEGRWSLVDRWESDDRRYIAAHANTPEQRDFRALSAQESVVLRYVALGASNKEIAFSLGLPMGSVATCVRRIRHRLGGRSRRDLIGIDHAEALQVDLEGDALAILRSPRARDSGLAARLTPREREVLEMLAGGASNSEIARAGGRSVKTVANQIFSIFAKLGVESRTEAAAKVLGGAIAAAPTARAKR
jgi:DNA-binding NarL/FixJ family response regulator